VINSISNIFISTAVSTTFNPLINELYQMTRAGDADVILCSRVLLKKLIIAHALKKFPFFHGVRMFFTAFTTARPWTLSWAK
jgi:hypothetical protein